MPAPPSPKPPDRIRCDYCQQWQVCQHVWKAKRGLFGRISYVYVWLCMICQYEIEII